MTREDIECIIKWFSHIEQLATDGKTANGFQMPPDKILATIKVVAKDSREYVEKFCYESTPNDLEEAAWDCVLDSVDVNNPVLLPKYKELLTYLFIAGAKWQAEHSPLPEDTVLFNKGVEEGKRLMMEEAVEGEVVQDLKGVNRVKSFNKIPEWLHFGDKVRIIICKKED